jgi:hypothetical protein
MSQLTGRRSALTLSAFAATAAGIALTAPATRAAAPPACRGSQLVTTIRQLPGGGTAGTLFEQLRFTNLGATCTLHGYPGVSAVSIGGRQLGRAARRVTGPQMTVTLRGATADSAATATATIGFVDTGALGRACHPTLAAGLRVYAPGASAAAYVPYVFEACSGATQASLVIKPVV